MSEVKLATLVQRLHHQTRTQKVAWRKGYRDEVFEAEFSAYNARLTRHILSQTVEDYVLEICDKDGGVLEKISDQRFHSPQPANDIFRLLKETYALASRCSMGASNAVDSILKDLN